jgi:hypothetical protein
MLGWDSGEWPRTLYDINQLPQAAKEGIYYTLLPDWIFTRFGVDRRTLTIDRQPVVTLRCPDGTGAMEITVKHHPDAVDPLCYINMADTSSYQLMVLMLVVNDPTSPRFNIDVDENGESTQLGTASRNIPEEIKAMNYGLAPSQIRSGLRMFRQDIPRLEQFVRNMGHDMFFIEPLAYHNAITFERYGFSYIRGKLNMERFHADFQPGGTLHAKLDGSTPFRHRDAWKTVRGRSWAIHDGILERPFTGYAMYKRLGREAGVNTFPSSVW